MNITYSNKTHTFSLCHDHYGLKSFNFKLVTDLKTYSSSEAICIPLSKNSFKLTWCNDLEATYALDVDTNLPQVILSLSITNKGVDPLSFKEIHLLDIESDGLCLGDGIKDWVLYKNGLRKNDMVTTHHFDHKDYDIKNLIGMGGELGDVHLNLSNDAQSYDIQSHYMTALLSKCTGQSLLFGSLDPENEFTIHSFKCSKAQDEFEGLKILTSLEYTAVEPNQEYQLGRLLISFDKVYSAIDTYATTARKKTFNSDSVPKTGWCSWYFFYEHITEQDIVNQLKVIKEYALPLESILIDMGWEERLGTWYANHKFKHGMRWIADQIKSYDMKPGLWLSPFWVEQRSLVHLHHPDWLLKDTQGVPVIFHCHVDGYVIDTSIPEACQWITNTFKRVTEEWGFQLVKVDFLRAVALYENAVFTHPMTRANALRLGMEAIRRGIGEDTTLIACGGQYGPTLGIADINRTSNDIRPTWSSVRDTFKKNMLRYWMNDNWWMNDPDCLIIRNEHEGVPGCTAGAKRNSAMGFTDTQVETILDLYKALKGTFYLGDDLTQLSSHKIAKLKEALEDMHYERRGAIPRDLFRHKYPHILHEEINSTEHLVTLVNWNDSLEESIFTLTLEDLIGSTTTDEYVVIDYKTKEKLTNLNKHNSVIVVQLPSHMSCVLKLKCIEID